MKNQGMVTALLAAGLTLFIAISSTIGNDWEKNDAVTLNVGGFEYAKELIERGYIVADGKGAWAEHQPSPAKGNEFIRLHGFGEYAKWHLGIDTRYAENTKRRYKFPYGDFKNVHRCGVLAVQSRAGQYKHYDIANAATQLKALIGTAKESNAKR